MAHRDAGNYRAKHASDRKMNQEIAREIEKKVLRGEIACADAEGIAAELKAPMGEVGIAIDFLEIRIVKCQLGLFGYGDAKMAINPANTVSPEQEKSIRDACVEGRLPCAAAWDIARRFNIPKMHVTSACEALRIRIKPCQLGAF